MNKKRYISSNPRIYGGRPVIDGTGIGTDAIAVRFVSGESVDELMADYELSREKIEAALRCELSNQINHDF